MGYRLKERNKIKFSNHFAPSFRLFIRCHNYISRLYWFFLFFSFLLHNSLLLRKNRLTTFCCEQKMSLPNIFTFCVCASRFVLSKWIERYKAYNKNRQQNTTFFFPFSMYICIYFIYNQMFLLIIASVEWNTQKMRHL